MQQPQALWFVGERHFVDTVIGRGGYGMVCRGVDRKTGPPPENALAGRGARQREREGEMR